VENLLLNSGSGKYTVLGNVKIRTFGTLTKSRNGNFPKRLPVLTPLLATTNPQWSLNLNKESKSVMAENANYETNSLGYKLQFKGPGSVEDYDRKGGKVGLCLEDGIDNTIYRGTLPEWQDAFGAELVKAFGDRQVNTAATEAARTRSKTPDKVKNVMETWSRYHARVMAGADDATKAQWAATAQKIADGIEVDPSPSKRQAGPAKAFLTKADSWLTLDDNALEAKITPALAAVPDFDLARDEAGKPERASLARLIELYVDTMV
jgi:hypothetical protein